MAARVGGAIGMPARTMKVLSFSVIRTATTYLLSFGLAKGTAFAAALALPRLVDSQTYGLLETAMTVGALGAAILGFGAPAVAMRTQLIEKDKGSRSILLLHSAWLISIALVAVGALAAIGREAQVVVCAAMVGLFALQFALSAYGRMQGQIHISGWLDNISIVVIVVIAALLRLFATADLSSFALSLVAVISAAGIAILFLLLGTTSSGVRAHAVKVVKLGMPMMFYGLSNMLVFASPRLAIAAALGLSDVVVFSVCVRIAAVLTFVSQAIQIGLLRMLYTIESAAFSRIMNVWIVALSGIALVLTLLAYFISHLLVAGTAVSVASFMAIFPMVATQAVLSVLNSNLEMYVNRELISRQASIALVAIGGLGFVVGLIVFASGLLSLAFLINLYSAVMAITLLAQMRMLSRRGMSFRSSYLVLPLTCAPLIVLLLPTPH
jgi:hypothetical protein